MGKRKRLILLVPAVLIGIQLFRPDRTNLPVDQRMTLAATTQTPDDVHRILNRACADCHSSQTTWPWYSEIAPISWVVADDVKRGRQELNFSVWGSYDPGKKDHLLEEVAEVVESREMPLSKYVFLHPDARLSDDEVRRLTEWANAQRATTGRPIDQSENSDYSGSHTH